MGKRRHKPHAQKQTAKKKAGEAVKPGKSRSRTKKITIAGLLLIAVTIILFNAGDLMRMARQYLPKSASDMAGLDELNYFPEPRSQAAPPAINFADFVGSMACAKCHQNQYDQWRSSTHGRAGGLPGEIAVIGRFDSTAIRYGDATVWPHGRDDDLSFYVDQGSGGKHDLSVDAIIGGGHMVGGGTQSYFSRFPDGTVRFLPFDFIKNESLWFSQLKRNDNWFPVKSELFFSDLSEWPPRRTLGTSRDFVNCQNCHGSQILVNFDDSVKRYETRFTSLTINCESCHGPGKRHVDLMQANPSDGLDDIGLNSLETLSKNAAINVCLQCHAVKDPVRTGYLSGMNLEDYYSLKMPILGQNPYLEDGRVRRFAYQQNHLYSDCYLNGSMTCGDCHASHSNDYRDINGRKLQGRFDNDQCLSCHPSKARSLQDHTFHKPNSPGSQCISCHMPYLQHQSTGDQLRFARSDHTIPIPRPEFDAGVGIENACIKCHTDKDNAWLQTRLETWYGELKPHKPVVAALLEETKKGGDRRAASLGLLDSADHPMAQVAGLGIFVKKYLSADMTGLDEETVTRLQALAQNSDLDVRSLALMSLHLVGGERTDIRGFLRGQLADLGESEHAVRSRWSIAMDYLGTAAVQAGDLQKGIRLHRKALEISPEDPVALVNLGSAYGNQGLIERAIGCFIRAIEIDPTYEPARLNLATAYGIKGEQELAISTYEEAVAMKPVSAKARLQLARAYLRVGREDKAREGLRAGLRFDPLNPEMQSLLRNLEGL